MVVEADGEIESIAASDGSEYPDSQDLIDLLEKTIPLDMHMNKYTLAVICIDVFIHENTGNKINAVEFRIFNLNYDKKVFLSYELNTPQHVVFKDWISC